MALWQFSFFLVPASWANAQSGDLWRFCGDDGWDLGNVWADEDTNDILDGLDDIFPKAKPWSEDMMIWRSEHHDSDIQAFTEAGSLYELCIRLDMRANVQKSIEEIVNFARGYDLKFFILHNAQICPPRAENLMEHALTSKAARTYIG